jgi:hypothetical protein
MDTSTDATTGLDHQNVNPGILQGACRGGSGDTCTDHDHPIWLNLADQLTRRSNSRLIRTIRGRRKINARVLAGEYDTITDQGFTEYFACSGITSGAEG